jgi:hypothetical protein
MFVRRILRLEVRFPPKDCFLSDRSKMLKELRTLTMVRL